MKEGLSVYIDGAVCRWKNTRLVVMETKDGDIFIECWRVLDGEDAGKVPPPTTITRGVSHTGIKFTKKAMEYIVSAYIHLQKSKDPNQ